MFFKKITSQNQIKFLELFLAVFLILIGVSLRLLPHPPNFAPITAIALFAGAYLSKKTALVLPIAAMVISDIFIGYYQMSLMAAIYGSFLFCVFLGFWLKRNKKWHKVGISAILGAVLFFLITNFAVWVFAPWYQKSFEGLIQCYFMALPFFRNTLLGNLFYTTLFFGVYELVRVLIRKKIRLINYGINSSNSSL